MKSIVISLVLLACACSKKDAPAPATGSGSAAGSAEKPAEKPPEPYTPAVDVAPPLKDAIAAQDRTINDRRLDAGRKPGEAGL